MFRFLSALSFILLFSHGVAHAQFTTNDPLSVDLSPQYPQPYETVAVTPGSTLIDLSAATVKVFINGKLVSTDSGIQTIPVNVGGPGEKTTVTVTATIAGKTYKKDVVIHPADVALVVEPVSTSHPMYMGALGLAPEGRVRVIGVADLRTSANVRLNPANLVYTWRFGNQILQSDSGLGHNVLTATAPPRYRDAQLTLTVTSVDGAIVAENSTLLEPVDPLVRIYRTAPLFGVDFDHALSDSYSLSGAEESFRGVAYFFGALPELAWTVNGQGSGADKDVTVRTTGAGAGSATLSLTARLTQTHQSITNSLRLAFGNKTSTNLFGF